MEKILFHLSFVSYGICSFLFLGYALTRRERWAVFANGALRAAVTFHFFSLVVRTFVGRQMPGHDFYVPWSNWFESFSFFAFVIALEYLVVQLRRELPILGVFITPFIFFILMVALKSPVGMQIPTLNPVLQSPWLAVHVSLMFVAYAAFANAFGVGLAFLVQERQIKSHKPTGLIFRMPSLDELDHMIYRIIWWAVPVLTMGLLLGSHWAYLAWGRYWGWDPKEISAAITWASYFFYLLMRSPFGWRGRKAVLLSIIGFLIMLGSYIGVNHYSPLHDFLTAHDHTENSSMKSKGSADQALP
ncbi:MAG: Cytochrome c biogenesis protein CcsA [Elusimicrobia bacterium]|nr:Cytochrome c biogenesis protein CcsA [Elusimicrobiota bacterium]